ncbi:YjcG family protein [Paucisalibacillus globulus]|jgi:2'-5' RNA ligase|uniref:YjcG family protein n=1 Tax=Paucisalibacillus globulus TaxID=351095 RepID=UPI000BB8FFAB|nr:YjcG family protein [Paucisalibacillus globulus]
MKYGIAIFPSKVIQDEANSYRKRYDPHYPLIPPHITLKEAFVADDDMINELIPELKRIANETEPITIRINKASSFVPVTNTIYLKVEPNEALTNLYEKLHEGKFPQNKKYAFVPHITIGQKLMDDEYSDVFGRLKMKSFDYEEEVDRFQLLYQLENGSWTVYESFVFGQELV